MAKRTPNTDDGIFARLSDLETRMSKAEARSGDADAKLETLSQHVRGMLRSIIRILRNRDKRTDVLEAAVVPRSLPRTAHVEARGSQVVPLRRRGPEK